MHTCFSYEQTGGKRNTASAVSACLLIVLALIFMAVSGCKKEETAKKVSLYKISEEDVHEPALPSPTTLWFGFDPRLGPKEEIQIYTPFLKYLEKATGKRFRIKFTEKYQDTVENLSKGTTHFAVLGTLRYVIGREKYGIKYLVSGVNKDGDPRDHSVIFTRADSSINNLSDLKGKCFAFGSEMSALGHLIPRKMMETEGVTLKDLDRYFYTGSHLNTLKAVLNGECDAGAIQDVMVNRPVAEGKIKIIKMSDSYPGSMIACHQGLDDKTVQAVKEALLAFEPTGKHKSMLVDWDRTEMPLGFTVLNESELQKVKDLAKEYGLLVNEAAD